MERKFNFEVGEYYHVYNRGIDKAPIFKELADWNRFRSLLYLSNSKKSLVFKLIQGDPLEWNRGETLADLLGYAQIPNHYHLIVKEKELGGVSKFMNKLSTAYSMYFNTKYERTGALLCRPFRAKHINNDNYLRWVFAYVHLNPLELFDKNWKEKGVMDIAEARKFMSRYGHSSFCDYYGEARKESKIITKDSLPIDVSNLGHLDQMLGALRMESLQGVPLE